MGRSRAGRWLALVVGIVLVGAVAACSSPSPEPFPQQAGVPPPSDDRPNTEVRPGEEPFAYIYGDNVRLSTKCGIQFLEIEGTTWETTPIGDGRPPPGWPTPYAKGRVVVVGEGGWDVERGWRSDPEDVFIFESEHTPNVIRFDFTTKTPPPCP
ncbi:MAG: hypothetical protein U0904_02510 [Candidatus Nanopelagicales bacterium]|nr:hypothetical protein [Candidatus Nanopelagicales bacterium]